MTLMMLPQDANFIIRAFGIADAFWMVRTLESIFAIMTIGLCL